ncbi:MAG: DUF6316 family protein [Pseudomonadaceae bacterium]|jgi:hypothetical protein|nr:DUF6316 family protein [Pseudomonadaceae bacterium]
MQLNDTPLASRMEGRLFALEGRLYLVVEVNTDTQTARVSCRANGKQRVFDMPVAEVAVRLSSNAHIELDGLNEDTTSKRITQQADGWYFRAREGLQGPFACQSEAQDCMQSYIVASQS